MSSLSQRLSSTLASIATRRPELTCSQMSSCRQRMRSRRTPPWIHNMEGLKVLMACSAILTPPSVAKSSSPKGLHEVIVAVCGLDGLLQATQFEQSRVPPPSPHPVKDIVLAARIDHVAKAPTRFAFFHKVRLILLLGRASLPLRGLCPWPRWRGKP